MNFPISICNNLYQLVSNNGSLALLDNSRQAVPIFLLNKTLSKKVGSVTNISKKSLLKYNVFIDDEVLQELNFSKKKLCRVLEEIVNIMYDEYMINYRVKFYVLCPIIDKICYKMRPKIYFNWEGESRAVNSNNITLIYIELKNNFIPILIKEVLWTLKLRPYFKDLSYKSNPGNILQHSVSDILFSLDQNFKINDFMISCFPDEAENIFPLHYKSVKLNSDEYDLLNVILASEDLVRKLVNNNEIQPQDTLSSLKSIDQNKKEKLENYMVRPYDFIQNKLRSSELPAKLKPNVDQLISDKINFLENINNYKNPPAKPKKVSNSWIKILENILIQFKLFVILPFLFVSCTPQTVDISTEIKEVSHLYDIGESKKAFELLEGLEPILLKKKYR